MMNDAGKLSKDEAVSIQVISSSLNSRMRILYESNIATYGGKPDYIIMLRQLALMVSVTRAFRLRYNRAEKKHTDTFDAAEATRLLRKKLFGLARCMDYSGYFMKDAGAAPETTIKPILHILCPSLRNMEICWEVYNNLLEPAANIQVIFSLVEDEGVFI